MSVTVELPSEWGQPDVVYKVVRPRVWTSIIASGAGQVTYHSYTVVKAPYNCAKNGYHLTAFKTLRDASTFARLYYGDILLCLAWDRRPLPVALEIDWALRMAKTGEIPAHSYQAEWPPGTVMYGAVMPLVLVERNEK